MRLEINNKNKKVHKTQTYGGNIIYYQTANGTVKRSKKNILKYWRHKRKHNVPNSMGHSKSNSKREVYSNSILPQETRKSSNKQPILYSPWGSQRIRPNWMTNTSLSLHYLKQPEKEEQHKIKKKS